MLAVIGIGSPFGDDQIGLIIYDEVMKCFSQNVIHSSDISFHRLDRPGLMLLSCFEKATEIVLIDAVVGGGAVGEVITLRNRDVIINKHLISSHSITVSDTVELAYALNLIHGDLVLYGVEIDPKHQSDTLSPDILNAKDQILHSVCQHIENYMRHVKS